MGRLAWKELRRRRFVECWSMTKSFGDRVLVEREEMHEGRYVD
jgi:hypothetical protein